jgi:hypoxanthine phosphoribosyltransferase
MAETPPALFTAEEIALRVEALASEIVKAPQPPDIAMPILVGGFVFAADLMRALSKRGLGLDVEMLWLRSYGDKRAAGAISMIAGPSEQIADRHVLIIDGVLDAGRTIAKARGLIEAAGAASVRVAVLLDKRRKDAVARADHVGFVIDDQFVIGYGMDDAGRHRGLPYIGVA